jgi:hypothetical protein
MTGSLLFTHVAHQLRLNYHELEAREGFEPTTPSGFTPRCSTTELLRQSCSREDLNLRLPGSLRLVLWPLSYEN